MHSIFNQVWVISLRRRPERLKGFFESLQKNGWPFRRPEVFWAIDGEKVGVPRYWQTGSGSYGCLRSHLSILERAIQDDVPSLLVLEDDAETTHRFDENVMRFMEKVPDNWECLMLGGQHVNSKGVLVSPGVVRPGGGGGIQRTHCYAIRGTTIMRELYKTWANTAVHCDWVMGPVMARFNTFAPDPFLVGQTSGYSDISGSQNPTKFWRSPTGREPVIILDAPRSVMEGLQRQGWHGGFTRDRDTGLDTGLKEIFDNVHNETRRLERLRNWIEMLQWEVASMDNAVACTIWHPAVTEEMVGALVKGPVVTVMANSIIQAYSNLPDCIRHGKQYKVPIVLLRSSREIMEELRKHGFHSGNWRDRDTGLDYGILEAMNSSDDIERVRKLIGVAKTLDEELGTAAGVATLWDSRVDVSMLPPDEFDILELRPGSVQEALQEYNTWLQGRQR